MDNTEYKNFSHVRNWIFDLDDTLYPYDSKLWKQIQDNIRDYISDYMKITPDEAFKKQMIYYKRFGTTLSGLLKETDVNPEHFVDKVHQLDLSVLAPDPELKKALDKLPGRKFVFTNGAHQHGKNVCERLGIYDCFDGYFGAKDTDFVPKPNMHAYEKLMLEFDIDPKISAFFEDTQKNLKTPHALGMKTVWLKNKNADHSSSIENADFCDLTVDNLVDCLNQIYKTLS